MSLAEVAEVVGGVVHDAGPGSGTDVQVVGGAFVDSRTPEPGGLFVALVGAQRDGHDFAGDAVRAGAAAVLGARPTGHPTVVVPDPAAGLTRLARDVASRLDATVVALTGSQGKTGTKDLLAAVLAGAGRTVATRGNANNEIGLPLTVLRADADTEFLVLEMGARHLGNIRELCTVARPDVALVLNVGTAHLGEFGSRENIACTKGEIVEALDPAGVAVLNADDPLVAAMAARTRGRVLTFGTGEGADVRLLDVHLDSAGYPGFMLAAREPSAVAAPVRLGMLGAHNAANAAAAAAAALACGIDLPAAAAVLDGSTAASRWRMELHERGDGVIVVNDAYNANPESMRAALETLAVLGRGRPTARTVAVLGEMLELGDSSRDEHDAVGECAVRLGVQQLVVVGDGARPIHEAACREQSWAGSSAFVPDTGAALAWLREHLTPHDVVLFKSSRDSHLRQLAEQVLADGARGGG
ncbi:MAG TPA: UDP-N-acetylmuramoyl-tripeptide--D-alanyl-D-alanine ligase [Nocardioidaceae bacterium]|nr:UDP-N-acetylmuramoyl-tripeptide--D-alanyl-D-alanine ligase [Nocardioidaceae bacterium]